LFELQPPTPENEELTEIRLESLVSQVSAAENQWIRSVADITIVDEYAHFTITERDCSPAAQNDPHNGTEFVFDEKISFDPLDPEETEKPASLSESEYLISVLGRFLEATENSIVQAE
jgi:hypothetical protein